MTVTMADVCDCGRTLQLHYRDPEKLKAMMCLIASQGPTVPVNGYMVPRHYLALHGVRPRELPELAKRYGWARA